MSKALDAEINKAFTEYSNMIEYIARREFESKVKPFFQGAHMVFLPGNGTYYIGKIKNGKETQIDPDTLPKWLYELLETELPGMGANSLGTIMPDYNPE